MARSRNRDWVDPALLRKMEEEIAGWERGEGPEPFWHPSHPNYVKPKKGSVKSTACQTPNCTGLAWHETNKFWQWCWPPNSFYCRLCRISRGLIATAFVLLVGLFMPLSLPTFGFGTTLCIFLLLGGAIAILPPLLMKAAK